ncbi:cyclic nucleotide-gated ion channel 1-like isoform X2 [Rosa rugosa]|uniref:cyclic nucleotide-gated ion channel 1-like isoform X3 n=1 Tax=Rosa rugosa TaxID=74645 RepID=UPI002B4121A0|nr:cyclic nucleotide-gated ion channel 1-like isoform X3 [Rosa rugosa]XP_062025105.1 cyclic nucleotide-gated ion channel 1-like isoform X2 [Rosa rugosa]
MSNKQVPNDVPMMSNTRGIKYNFDNVEAQPPDPPCGDRDAVSTKEKFKGTLLSISFWNKMFVIACVIAVSLDPLFFYIPIIDEEEKCLAEDKELRTIALILRSLTDVTFVVNIIYHVCEAINAAYRKREEKKPELASDWEFAKLVVGKLAWRSTLTSILAVFPMPQVLGAFWYFFSIQRETSCWHWACVDHSTNVEGCMSTLYCEVHNTTPRNATFLNQFCLISAEENAKGPSDFGIFLDSLKNGITGNIPFGKKLSYSFWWGLRNLSNFGTNLETSTYVWENCFAVFISIIGLLLFLYLLGNVQTFMSMEIHRWETQRWENQRREDERNKIQLKEKYSGWMDRNEIPDDLKKKIMKNIEQKLEENKDTDPKNLFSILPTHTRTCLKRFLGLKLLKKVPKLARMDKRVLKMMCDYLKPVMHDEGDEVFQMGAPLHRMLLITEGTLLTDRNAATENAKTGSISSSPSVGNLGKGDFYGAEELIEWVTQKKDLGQLPASSFNVKCNSKVEGFVLKAKQLRSVVSKNENRWKMALASQTTA